MFILFLLACFCYGTSLRREEQAQKQEFHLLEEARKIGSVFAGQKGTRAPVLLVPGVGGSVLEQQLRCDTKKYQFLFEKKKKITSTFF